MPEYLRETNDGLTLEAYSGDSCALLAFDVDPRYVDDLAGFAVEYDTPNGETSPLFNRLRFDGRNDRLDLVETDPALGAPSLWTLQRFEPAPGFVAALAWRPRASPSEAPYLYE